MYKICPYSVVLPLKGSAKKILSLLGVSLISGCSLAPQIQRNVSDYHQVFAQSADTVVLDNILRASYDLPLHFSILSKINGTITTSLQFSGTAPFGEFFAGGNARDSVSSQFSVGSSPTFEVDTLETKNFTAGIMAPVDPEVMKQIVDSGLDSRVAMMLFVSGLRLSLNGKSSEEIFNNPNSRRYVCYGFMDKSLAFSSIQYSRFSIMGPMDKCVGASEPEMFAFLRILDQIGMFFPNNYTEYVPIGLPIPANTVQTTTIDKIVGIDPTKTPILSLDGGKTFSVFTIQKKLALCELTQQSNGLDLLFPPSDSRCQAGGRVYANNVLKSDGQTVPANAVRQMDADLALTESDNSHLGQHLEIANADLRSVAGMFDYVGAVVAYQRNNDENHIDRCITVEGDSSGDYRCGSRILDIFFKLRNYGDQSAFSVNYNGQEYYVGSKNACVPPVKPGMPSKPCDFSNDVINALALLLGLNIQPSDIPQTPLAQLVP